MLTDAMPKLRVSAQIVNDHMIDGYKLECPDRIGFLYAILSENQKTLLAMLDYKGTQHTLLDNNYIGLANDAAIDQCFRKLLINASQAALTIMYE